MVFGSIPSLSLKNGNRRWAGEKKRNLGYKKDMVVWSWRHIIMSGIRMLLRISSSQWAFTYEGQNQKQALPIYFPWKMLHFTNASSVFLLAGWSLEAADHVIMNWVLYLPERLWNLWNLWIFKQHVSCDLSHVSGLISVLLNQLNKGCTL